MITTSPKGIARQLRRRWQYFGHYQLHNFVFIHINKTAGRSIGKSLGLPFEHKTTKRKIEELGRAEWDKRFTFTFVRNPWDRAVSLYHFRVKTNQTNLKTDNVSFEDWVKLCFLDQDPYYYNTHKMFMPQLDWLTDQADQPAIDFIGKFENLNQDFDEICDRIGRVSTLEHLHRSKRKSYRDYYNEETVEVIRTFYQKDINFFDYSFEK